MADQDVGVPTPDVTRISYARPLTPSRWHDQRWREAPAHDQMQAEFLAFLRSRKVCGLPESVSTHRHVEGEMPFVRNGQIIAYADAVEVLTVGLTTIISLYEIKPRIDTVFGIVRQAKALLQVATVAKPADMHFVHVVAPHTDPAIAELRAEWPHTWAWGAVYADLDWSEVLP